MTRLTRIIQQDVLKLFPEKNQKMKGRHQVDIMKDRRTAGISKHLVLIAAPLAILIVLVGCARENAKNISGGDVAQVSNDGCLACHGQATILQQLLPEGGDDGGAAEGGDG